MKLRDLAAVAPAIVLASASLAQNLPVLHSIDGASAGECLGWSVCSAGDLTGDGKPDLAIGAFNASPGGKLLAGRIVVVNGDTGGVVFGAQGNVQSECFGSSVALSPDLDLDGIPDLLVGAPNQAFVSNPTGYVRIVSGADGSEIRTLFGLGPTTAFGRSVASVGDEDGDGFAEIAVGAPGVTGVGTGQVRIYSGADGSFLGDVDGIAFGDNLGHSVAGLGDVDGDGVADFAAGAPGLDLPGKANAGMVVVYSGATRDVLRVHLGKAASAALGYSVANAGLVDGDAACDLLVGAIGVKAGTAVSAGAGFVFSGANGKLLRTLPGTTAGDLLGTGVAGLGDVTGDGVSDLAVGASSAGSGGEVRIWSGKTGKLVATLVGADGDLVGDAIASADVNGDGVPDLVAGAWNASPGGLSTAGQARVHSLAPLVGLGNVGTVRVKMALQHDAKEPAPDASGKVELAAKGDFFQFLVDAQKLVPLVGTGFHVFLETAPASGAFTEIAQLVAGPAGKWKLQLSGEGGAPPELGTLTFAPLAGRRLEIRDDAGTVYLWCILPPLVGLETFKVKLPFTSGAGSSATGTLTLSFQLTTGSSVFDLVAKSLEAGVVYGVFLEDAPGAGTFTQFGVLEGGKLKLDTKKGDPLPLGASTVADLSGRRVQVRDGATVILEVTIP